MDGNFVVQAIGTLGFPIVCCGALFWRMVVSDKQHLEEIEKMSTAINNNTTALTGLITKLGEGKENK